MTSWAFATAGYDAQELFEAIVLAAAPQLPNFPSKLLAMLVFALVKHGSASGRVAPAGFLEIVANLLDEHFECNNNSLAAAAADAARAAALGHNEEAIKLLDPPLIDASPDGAESTLQVNEHMAAQISTVGGRTRSHSQRAPAYRCNISFDVGKHGENKCPQICSLFYLYKEKLWCTWCLDKAGGTGLAWATTLLGWKKLRSPAKPA